VDNQPKELYGVGQFGQDCFVDKILDMDGGFFLDIGAGISHQSVDSVGIYSMSNTYWLESERKWTGIGIDYDEAYINAAKQVRPCKLLCVDLMENNINEILEQNNCPENIDYLSFDVDDAQSKVFSELDFSKYQFRVITYEHNLFRGNPEEQKVSRATFKALGYKLLFGNVGYMAENGVWTQEAVEDWYVDAEIFQKHGHLAEDNLYPVEALSKLE
jgi:hypothetical protein